MKKVTEESQKVLIIKTLKVIAIENVVEAEIGKTEREAEEADLGTDTEVRTERAKKGRGVVVRNEKEVKVETEKGSIVAEVGREGVEVVTGIDTLGELSFTDIFILKS